MSLDQKAVGEYLGRQMLDFFDGFVLCGFVAGSNAPVIVFSDCNDPKTVLALNRLLESAKRPENNQ